MAHIGSETQVQIRGADGTILWTGGQVIATSYIVTNNEAATAMTMGEGVTFDPQTVALGFIPRLETTAAGATPTADLPGTLVLGALRSPASANASVPFLGVTMEPVGAGKKGLVAGAGSLCTVQVTTAALTLALKLSSSASAGLLAAATDTHLAGFLLGICIKINTTGATGTGSTSWAGVLVNPS